METNTENINAENKNGMENIIVITSGKGGVGKTTTTANIGVGLAKRGKKTVLVDRTAQSGRRSRIGKQNSIRPRGRSGRDVPDEAGFD